MIKSNVSKPALVKLLFISGIVILIFSSLSYWHIVYNSPGKVFSRMLKTSLSTVSVTKVISQADESQNLRQAVVLRSQPKPLIRSISVLAQGANGDTKVTTESISTPLIDFVRYNDIQTNQKNEAGSAFDFKDVVGVWGKTDDSDTSGNGAQLFNQTLLGVVPFANINKAQRDQLLNQINKNGVYEIDTSKVKRQYVNARPIYTYEVTVRPVAYVTMLKAFAQANGLTQLDQVNPDQYTESSPLTFTFEVDILSSQLTKIIYSQGQRTETYGSYGARVAINPPESSIPVGELQTRLQKIR
ncbi:MAG: hypothetical protein V4702_04495 [Patescibacteria group bacterium]